MRMVCGGTCWRCRQCQRTRCRPCRTRRRTRSRGRSGAGRQRPGREADGRRAASTTTKHWTPELTGRCRPWSPACGQTSLRATTSDTNTRHAHCRLQSLGQQQEQTSSGKYRYLCNYPRFLITSYKIGTRKLPCQNQLDSFSRFNRTPNCDRHRQTDRQTDTEKGPWLVPRMHSIAQ